MTGIHKIVMSKLLIILLSFIFFSFSALAELSLTKDEKQWIKDNPIVKFTGDPNWLPYEAFDEKGNYIGIVSEYLKIISKETGLIFKMSRSKTWTESVNKAKSKKVDVLSETDDSDLKSHLDFTVPYISNPIVIVMRNDENYVENINLIKDKKIALIKDYGYAAKIRRKYANIRFITVEDIQDGLVSVSTGKIDALLCTLALCSYTVSELGLNNVKITGKSEFDTKLALGVQKNLPILRSILDKSIEVISHKQQQDILSHWIKNKTVKFIDYTLIVKVSIIFTILLIIFYFWNRRLSHEIKLRIKTESESKKSRIALEESEERYRLLASVSPVGIYRTNSEGECVYVNERWCELAGMTENEAYNNGWSKALHPEDSARVFSEWGKSIEDNVTFKTECRFMRPDGKVTWLLSVAEAEYDTKGNTIGYVGAVTDISGRKSIELSLQESEDLLERAQKLAHIGHWKLNPATGEVTGSDEFFRIFGVTRDEATLDIFIETVHPDDREIDVAAIRRGLKHGESWNIEHRLICRDGTEKWVHAVGEALKDADGNVVELLGTVQDITKEKLIDIEFEESSRRFKAMFESIPDAIVYADPERKISMVNGAAINMFGYEEAELTGHQTKMLYAYPDDFVKQGLKRFNSKVVKQLTPNVITYKTKMGDEFPGETLGTAVKTLKGDVLGYIGIIRDISEREHVDDILKSLASGNANLDFSTFMNDVLTRISKLYNCKYAFIGRLQEDNKSIKTLSVMASGNVVDDFEYELEGTPCQDILNITAEIIPKDVCLLYPSDTMLVDMGIESYFGAPLIASDGSLLGLLSVMDTSEMELDEWTEPVLGVFAKRVALEVERDIADQKLKDHQEQLEEQVKIRTLDLVAARNEAERANKAKSEFLSSMSHELRTPMNAILGFGQMLELDASDLSDIQNSNVKEILDAGNYLLNLINQVLNLAQIESGKLEIQNEKISLTNVIDEVLKLMATTINNRNITFVNNISEHDFFVIADFMKLKQIFINIISNAIKYNHESGKVTINYDLKDNKRIRISISDTGIGLSEHEISRIFHPFERFNISENVEGTGIGLTITKHLCELMGGELGVDSTPGEGSTFWLDLELA